MQVQGSAVNFQASHELNRQESLVTVARERVLPSTTPPPTTQSRPNPPPGHESPQPERHPLQHALKRPHTAQVVRESKFDPFNDRLGKDILLLKYMVEALTGEELDLDWLHDFSSYRRQASTPQPATAETPSNNPPTNPQATPPDNRQFETTVFTHYHLSEYEYSSVQIEGEFLISDEHGTQQSLQIQLSVAMQRSYEESLTSLTTRSGKLTDPLVVNFNGLPVQLSSDTTAFDLNSDGALENIATLASGSAYLALDKNEDGLINNGSELFGTATGNGFQELAQYDEDGNGFIDSGDAIYTRLSLYRPADNFSTSLQSMGIAALYTDSVSSPFQINDSDNNNLGAIRSTGFFIGEDGSAGSVQQIDLRV